jgi:pathogenesis-related protein 1
VDLPPRGGARGERCSIAALPAQVVLIRAQPTACTSATVSTTLTADEQQEMVRLHNQERSEHGSGALTWDATLASCAQDWAEQRARTKDAEVHRPKNKFGENTYHKAGTATPADAMDFWGGEQQFFDSATQTCKAGTECRHFIQVVWSTTTKIGCGKAPGQAESGPATEYWVCNYDPPGNTGGGPFGAGTPATGGSGSGSSACPQPGADGLRCLIDAGRAAAGRPKLASSGPLDAVATTVAQNSQTAVTAETLTSAGYCPGGRITSHRYGSFGGGSPQAAFDHFSASGEILTQESGDLGIGATGNSFVLVYATCG